MKKTPAQLSEGMKVKYPLALALSHHAELLILDEPTSGLDPVSRDDLLDVFMDLVENERMSILFSTHITSDLEKCADNIIYIKNGAVIACKETDAFLARYKVAEFSRDQLTDSAKAKLIGCKRDRHGMSGLIRVSDLPIIGAKIRDAILEDIMVHIEKEDGDEKPVICRIEARASSDQYYVPRLFFHADDSQLSMFYYCLLRVPRHLHDEHYCARKQGRLLFYDASNQKKRNRQSAFFDGDLFGKPAGGHRRPLSRS